ncbi:hypothetical protein DFJ74DRAFT_5492 [Hyaloraphidium curvatum]|nr:hypothetical protein DFJ74DRAFT_5492 [Hyaloraphidium curvatum]
MRGGGDSASGFIAHADSHPEQFQLVPFTLTIANPSGMISSACWAALKEMLLDSLRKAVRAAGGVDCVALHLHGAGVAQDSGDLEGVLLEEIRGIVGGAVVVANLDLHGKMTPKMHANVDVINAVLTYPHIDHNPRSQQLLALVPGIRSKKIRPVRYVERLPFTLMSAPTVPGQGFLMSEVREMCEAAMRRPGVLDCSVLHGFPFSDIEDAGVHVFVTTDGDGALAKEVALEISKFIWTSKDRAMSRTKTPAEAVAKAKEVLASQGRLTLAEPKEGGRRDAGTFMFVADATDHGPVIIADAADNPGGGTTGDATYLLREMLDSKVERAAFVGLFDPELVQKLSSTPVGTFITDVSIGGRSGPWSGPPVVLPRAYLKSVAAGRMTFRGYSSPTRADLGVSACLVVPETGFHVVVISRNVQVFDDNWMISHGIVPKQFRLIGLKSSVHFRAFFKPGTETASEIIISDGQPGLTSHNLEAFPKTKNVEPLYPYDLKATWDERGRGMQTRPAEAKL